MNETIIAKIAALSFMEILILMGFIVFCAICLLIGIAAAFDKLNVKSFSFRNGFVFYQEGETKVGRVSGRKKTVRRKAK